MEKSQKNWLEKLEHDVKAMLAAMPPVDVQALRRQYRAEHAAEIAAHEKYMSDMRAVCRIFERHRTAAPATSSASAPPGRAAGIPEGSPETESARTETAESFAMKSDATTEI